MIKSFFLIVILGHFSFYNEPFCNLHQFVLLLLFCFEHLLHLQYELYIAKLVYYAIMGGPVLSHCEQLKLYVPAPESLQRIKVSDLIQSVTSDWDMENIELSLPFHKEQILKIKPNSLRAEDALVWLKNSSENTLLDQVT